MVKKRSAWIPIFAIVMLILNVINLLRWKTTTIEILSKVGEHATLVSKILRISFVLLLLHIIAYIGLLLYKEWGRQLLIGASIAACVLIYLFVYLFSKVLDVTFIEVLLASKLQIIAATALLALFLFILNRKSVKEQFK